MTEERRSAFDAVLAAADQALGDTADLLARLKARAAGLTPDETDRYVRVLVARSAASLKRKTA